MKISIVNFNKMIESCTAKEIDVFLLLAAMQNQYGEVLGVTYNQVCEEIGICHSYFYKILYQLEGYGLLLISYVNEDYGTWKVQLRNNQFQSKEDFRKGYFKTNRKVLYSAHFRELNRTEKVILLKLLFMQAKKGHKFKVFLSTIERWTAKSGRTVRRAIERLMELHLINVISDFGNGFSFAAKPHELGGDKAVENEAAPRMKQLILLAIRRKKVQAEASVIRDTINVLKLYKERLDEYFLQKLERCIEDCGSLQSAYLNKMISA